MNIKALTRRYAALLSVAFALVATHGYASNEATVIGKNSDATPAITAQNIANKRANRNASPSEVDLSFNPPAEFSTLPVDSVSFDRDTIRMFPVIATVSTAVENGMPAIEITADILTVFDPEWGFPSNGISFETAMIEPAGRGAY